MIFDSAIALVLIVTLVCGLLGTLGQLAHSRRLRRWINRHCEWQRLERTWLRWGP